MTIKKLNYWINKLAINIFSFGCHFKFSTWDFVMIKYKILHENKLKSHQLNEIDVPSFLHWLVQKFEITSIFRTGRVRSFLKSIIAYWSCELSSQKSTITQKPEGCICPLLPCNTVQTNSVIHRTLRVHNNVTLQSFLQFQTIPFWLHSKEAWHGDPVISNGEHQNAPNLASLYTNWGYKCYKWAEQGPLF